MWDVASCHSEYKNHLMHRSWVFQLCHGRETYTKKIALFPLICFVVLFLCGFKMTQGWRDVRVQKWTTNYGYKHSSRWGMGKIDCSHVPSRSDRSLGRYPRILLSMGHRILTMKLTHSVPVHLSLDQQPFISYGMPAKTNVGSGTQRIYMNMFGFPCPFQTQVSRMGGKKQKKKCVTWQSQFWYSPFNLHKFRRFLFVK